MLLASKNNSHRTYFEIPCSITYALPMEMTHNIQELALQIEPEVITYNKKEEDLTQIPGAHQFT